MAQQRPEDAAQNHQKGPALPVTLPDATFADLPRVLQTALLSAACGGALILFARLRTVCKGWRDLADEALAGVHGRSVLSCMLEAPTSVPRSCMCD